MSLALLSRSLFIGGNKTSSCPLFGVCDSFTVAYLPNTDIFVAETVSFFLKFFS